VSDKHHVGQIVREDRLEVVIDVVAQPQVSPRQVGTLAIPGQRRRERPVPGCFEKLLDRLPDTIPVNKNKDTYRLPPRAPNDPHRRRTARQRV
jgi:hypothetical protein